MVDKINQTTITLHIDTEEIQEAIDEAKEALRKLNEAEATVEVKED